MSRICADFDVDTPIDHNFNQIINDKIIKWESTLPDDYWAYRRKWEENPKNFIVGKYPIHLDIEATNACNLKCVMCPRTDMVNAGVFWKIQSFDFEKYKNLIDEGVKNGLCSIKYNYLGEPTMNPHLTEMIRYAKRAGIIDIMFNTNATLLNDKLSRDLIASGLDKLFFSFDSPYRESYNKIRVGSDYEKVLGNIKRFMEIRKDMGSTKPFTRVSMLRMRDNEDECEEFQRIFEPIADAIAYIDYLDHPYQNRADRMIVPIGSRKNRFCCPQLWQRMFVHPDGVATICCVDSAREMQVGNIYEQSIKEIWLGDKYQKIRKLHSEGRSNEISLCARCYLSKY